MTWNWEQQGWPEFRKGFSGGLSAEHYNKDFENIACNCHSRSQQI